MRKLLFVLSLSFLLFSCSSSLGFGVVIWKEENDVIEVGDIVKVYAKSEASKIYIVAEEEKDNKIEMPMWKLLLSATKKDALELKERLESLKHMYAASGIDGLPLRMAPDNLSKQIYRLRSGQVVKLLWEGDGAIVMSGNKKVEGKWYEVMTEDSTKGWCFSHNLNIFDGRVGRRENEKNNVGIMASEEEENNENTEDEALNRLITSTWYPEYYRKMLNNKMVDMVDLESISPSYGFFVIPSTNTARVNLPKIQRTFPYSKIKKAKNKYRFGDSPLSVYIRNVDIITVEFTDEEGTRLYENFVTLNAPLEVIIENEKARRENEMKKLSGFYTSQNYGKLEITEEGYFSWTGYNAIVPFIIAQASGNAGTISFKYFLSRAVRKNSQYDGVISFQFENVEDSSDFMYKTNKDSIVLEPVAKDCIENGVVNSRSNILTLFFSKTENTQ